MGRKLPNEPQHGDLKANTARGKEPETQLFKFPGRNLESNKTSKKKEKLKKKEKKEQKVMLDTSTYYGVPKRNKKQGAFLGFILNRISTHGCKVILQWSGHVVD